LLLEYYDDTKTLVEAVSEYLSIYPDDVCATYYLADKKVELKEYDEAEKLANDILAKYEDFYFAHLLLAEIYCEKGDYNKSVEHCNRVLADNRQNTAAFGKSCKSRTQTWRCQERVGTCNPNIQS